MFCTVCDQAINPRGHRVLLHGRPYHSKCYDMRPRVSVGVFAAMEAQQSESTPALAAALDRHAAAIAARAEQTAAAVRQMIHTHSMLHQRPQCIYLGEREYQALRNYCGGGDPETSGRLTEFEGVPVLEVKAPHHLGAA